jgi:glycosidase
MVWEPARWDHDLLAAVKKYIALRKKYTALWRHGAYTRLYAQDMVYIFARQRGRQTVIVGVNAGQSAMQLDLNVQHILSNGSRVSEAWGSTQLTVADGCLRGLTLPARDGNVWVGEP